MDKMAARIQKVARAAFDTFQNKLQRNVLHDQMSILKALVNSITPEDLNFDNDLVKNTDVFSMRNPTSAPVTYVNIWETDVFSIGIFVLRNGATIPLHNHPNMYGLCKLLHGKARIRSFTEIKNRDPPQVVLDLVKQWQSQYLIVTKQQADNVIDNNGMCEVEPVKGNIHEITAINGPMAFLDILAPPYDHDHGTRECSYFKQVEIDAETQKTLGTVKWLMLRGQPEDFWCDSAPYRGPDPNPYLVGI